MAYKNLHAEMARNGMNRKALCDALKNNGIKISYQKLARQLRGEVDIPYVQACMFSKIFGCKLEYIMEMGE